MSLYTLEGALAGLQITGYLDISDFLVTDAHINVPGFTSFNTIYGNFNSINSGAVKDDNNFILTFAMDWGSIGPVPYDLPLGHIFSGGIIEPARGQPLLVGFTGTLACAEHAPELCQYHPAPGPQVGTGLGPALALLLLAGFLAQRALWPNPKLAARAQA